jgi:hypothetical protein
VTRQELEQAVASQPGLRPPYNEPTQARLAGVVGARSVFSGRVLRTIVQNGRSAACWSRCASLTPRRATTSTAPDQRSDDEKLQQFDNDVLVDEAINKAAFAAVRSMKQTSLPSARS